MGFLGNVSDDGDAGDRTSGPPDQTQHIRGLFIAAIVFACVGFGVKIAQAAGFKNPLVMLLKQLRLNNLGQSGVMLASMISNLLESLCSLAVVFIAIAIGLVNGYFDFSQK